MSKFPWFPFYPADWLSDSKVMSLPWDAKGLYIHLLAICWREGSIPSDRSAIAQLSLGCSSDTVQLVSALFVQSPNNPDRLINKRLEAERETQESKHKERSESGLRGNTKRWKTAIAQRSLRDRNQSQSQSQSQSQNVISPLNPPKGDNGELPLIGEKRNRKDVPTPGQAEQFASEIQLPLAEVPRYLDYWEARGWMIGRGPVKSWKATMRTWKKNWEERRRSNPVYDPSYTRSDSEDAQMKRQIESVIGMTLGSINKLPQNYDAANQS